MDKWPLANGNWSTAANWNGGTLPVDGDNIYADNRIVTIDQHINLPNANLFTTARSGGTSGGQFSLSGAWNLTCLSLNPGSTLCISISANYTGAITCPTVNPSATAAVGAISVTGGLAHAFSIVNANFYAGIASGRIAVITSGACSGTITLINCTAHTPVGAVANCISHQSSNGLVIQGTCNLVQASANSLLQAQTAAIYNLTGTILAGGNAIMITLAAGGECTYVCTAFAWNSPINSSNVLFSSSSAGLLSVTMPPITMHGNTSGPILMSTNLAGSNCRYTGDITAGIATLFQTVISGAKLEHFGKITCNPLSGASLNATAGSQLIIDKIEAAANGNFISLSLGGGIRVKNTTCLYFQDVTAAVKTLSVNGGVIDYPIPANVRSGVVFNNGTQTGTMIDHDARFDAINDKLDDISQWSEMTNAVVEGKLDTMLVLDGAVWQFTTNALELGGGGGLDAAGVRAAIGMAAANMDSQLNSLGSTLVTIGSYIDTEVSAIKSKTDQLVFTVPNQIDANALTGGGGGGLDAAGVRAAVGLAAANLDGQLSTITGKTNLIGTGAVAVIAMVSPTGEISSPIIIGDDYLEANNREFSWVVPAVPGVVMGTAQFYFGGKPITGGPGWLVLGEISDAGGGNWRVAAELPRTATTGLIEGLYRWSGEIRDVSGNEVTRIRSDSNRHVQLVSKQT